MSEEIKITDAEMEAVAESKEETAQNKEKKAKTDFYVEIALVLILGILIGVAAKTEANKRITIGFNDYKMRLGVQQYNINKMQSDLIKKLTNEADSQEHAQDPNEGATCGQ